MGHNVQHVTAVKPNLDTALWEAAINQYFVRGAAAVRTTFLRVFGASQVALNDIKPRRTSVSSPKTNGFVERFHGTVLEEFFMPKMREKLY